MTLQGTRAEGLEERHLAMPFFLGGGGGGPRCNTHFFTFFLEKGFGAYQALRTQVSQSLGKGDFCVLNSSACGKGCPTGSSSLCFFQLSKLLTSLSEFQLSFLRGLFHEEPRHEALLPVLAPVPPGLPLAFVPTVPVLPVGHARIQGWILQRCRSDRSGYSSACCRRSNRHDRRRAAFASAASASASSSLLHTATSFFFNFFRRIVLIPPLPLF